MILQHAIRPSRLPIRNLMRTMLLIAAAAVLALSGGCNRTYVARYQYTGMPELGLAGNRPIALAVHDQRPYVINGEREPQWVGQVRRGLFAVPWYAGTESERALAADLQQGLETGLERCGFKVTAVPAPHTDPPPVVLERLKRTAAPRAVYVILEHWKSDTNIDTWLEVDTLVRVYDETGKQLAERRLKKSENLRGTFVGDAEDWADKAVPPGARKMIRELFEDEAVRKAIEG
jgi:hypothetical protein